MPALAIGKPLAPAASATAPTPRPEEVAAEVGHALNKVLGTYRFYAEGHSALEDVLQRLSEAVRRYHDVTSEAVVLHVRASTLLLGEVVLVEATSPKDSVTRPLFLEGVQEILFQPGLELAELSAFLGMWHRAQQRALPAEYDFYTWFWEQGFEDIELVVAEVPTTTDAGAESAQTEALLSEREEQLFTALTRRQGTGSGQRLTVGHDEWLARLEAEVLAPVHAEDLKRTGAPAFTGASEAEVAELRALLERERNPDGLHERGLWLVWALLAVCRDEERPALMGWAEELLAGLVSAGRWTALTHVVQGMTRDARAMSARAPDLHAVTRLLLREGIRTGLAQTSEQAQVLELLGLLQRDALQGATDLLFEMTSSESRGALARLLLRRGIPLMNVLVTRAASLNVRDLEWVRPLRESGPDAQPLTAALLGHPQPVVRVAIIARLEKRDVDRHRALLLKLLADPNTDVRSETLALLLRHGVEGAVGPLVTRLETRLDRRERMAVVRALADLGGPVAATALRQAFEREQDTELKAHCAQCMGILGDPRARPLLEATARKLFAPRTLKLACREALALLAPGA
ncbi:hypothetical protein DRW03_16190 [Corallococcus sp. H22C18031201]|nr:hypothetical protein DRW03_16190 [Corallococcus sp. H22C18031201]